MNWTVIILAGMFFGFLSLSVVCYTIMAIKTHDPNAKETNDEDDSLSDNN